MLVCGLLVPAVTGAGRAAVRNSTGRQGAAANGRTMSQILSQHLGQHMRLEQRLTPQLIQSMAILQKPVADLETFINEALESNPALEREEAAPAESAEPPPRDREPAPDAEAAGFARLDRFHRSYDHDYDDGGAYRPRRVAAAGERDAKMDAMANTAGRDGGLNEHLLDQWALLDLDAEVRRAGVAIIQQLSPDGYLQTRVEEIASDARPLLPRETVEAALAQVRRLDPPGVGASDLVDCLLLQIDALPGDNSIERRLVQDHLDDIAQNRLPQIAKATGYSLGEISEAIKAIRSSLHPHPGYLVSSARVPIVRPDVLVDYADTGGGLTIGLARGNSPRLKISDRVAEMARSREQTKDVRDYARRQIEDATAILDAVKFRQSRLLEVSKAIAEHQREFFEIGPQGLKVLRMADLAAELNCDPSTISRTVADKYMQTPRGVFPLRYFFTGGMETADGESAGWDRVKNRVREIVEQENRKSPLSDDQIAAMLKKEGTEISRRTVAKYRAQLGIGSTRQRKVFE